MWKFSKLQTLLDEKTFTIQLLSTTVLNSDYFFSSLRTLHLFLSESDYIILWDN